MSQTKIEQIFHPILDELLRKNPLPWHIVGTGPYEVISSDRRTIAQNLRDEDAKAIIDYAKKRQAD
jgi:hypothetical protein